MYDAWQGGGSAGQIALAGLTGAATGALATLGGGWLLNVGVGAIAGGLNKFGMNAICHQDLSSGLGKAAFLGGAGNALGNAIAAPFQHDLLQGLAGRSAFFNPSADLSLAEGLVDVLDRGEAMAAYNSVVTSAN
jgi:hypothetical protein